MPRPAKVPRAAVSFLSFGLGVLAVFLLREIRTQRDLGRRPLGDTGLDVEVVQSRSIGAPVGIGQTKTWFLVTNRDGTTQLAQEIPVIGGEAREWAEWLPQERVELTAGPVFQTVEIPLRYDSGREIRHEVNVGIISPAPGGTD